MDGLRALHEMDRAAAFEALMTCCGSHRWVEAMVAGRPYLDPDMLAARADAVWRSLGPDDWREAFSHHPRVGGDDLQRRRFDATRAWSSGEQSGMERADDDLRRRLAAGNDAYFERFGHVFLICATGKSAAEMLAALEARLDNGPDEELQIAAEEQRKITRLRLRKLLGDAP